MGVERLNRQTDFSKKMNREESKTDTRIKSGKWRPEATKSTWNLPCPNQTQLQMNTIKNRALKYQKINYLKLQWKHTAIKMINVLI